MGGFVSVPEFVPELRSNEDFEGPRPTAEAVNAFEDAIRRGEANRVEEMVRECPWLLAGLTLAGETPLHVAINAGQFQCLKILLEAGDGMSYLNPIINHRDQTGNTVLDLWRSSSNPLAPQDRDGNNALDLWSRSSDPLTPQDQDGNTAPGLCCSSSDPPTPQTPIPRPTGHVILDVDPDASSLTATGASQRARHRRMDSSPPVNSQAEEANAAVREVSKESALLTVGAFVAGGAFACLFSLDDIFPVADKMMVFSKPPPDIFIFLVFNTAAFIGAMLLIVTNTYSLVARSSLFSRVVPMVVMAGMSAGYAVVLKNVVTKNLCLAIASSTCSISSFSMVWLYSFGFLSSVLAMWFIGSWFFSAFFN